MSKLIGSFSKSKVAKKVVSDSDGKGMLAGDNSSGTPGFKSGTKHTTNPTSSSGNTSAPMGHPSLTGAHGNKAKRSLAY